MRPVEERFNPHRNIRSRTVTSKYIIVTEGYRTEQIYFDALRDNRSLAGISSLIEIVLLQREVIDAGLSHPTTLLNLLDEYMRCVRSGRYSVDIFLEVACNSTGTLSDVSRADRSMSLYRDKVRSGSKKHTDESGFVTDIPSMIETCIDAALETFRCRPQIDLPELIDYRPEVDKVCVIVDRDRDNRDASVMDDFVRRCRRCGYRPYISNPCFEVWLMMHFEEFDLIDRKELLRNPMISNKRFSEVELDRIVRNVNPINHYSKTDFDPGMFMHRTDEAISRSMGSCHNVNHLKGEMGTNLGELLNEMHEG